MSIITTNEVINRKKIFTINFLNPLRQNYNFVNKFDINKVNSKSYKNK